MVVLDPSILRVAVAGNIIDLPGPKKVLAEKFLPIKVSSGSRTMLMIGIETPDPDLSVLGYSE